MNAALNLRISWSYNTINLNCRTKKICLFNRGQISCNTLASIRLREYNIERTNSRHSLYGFLFSALSFLILLQKFKRLTEQCPVVE